MNNTFPLFYSPKPWSQVWILIYRKWSNALYSLTGFKIITLWTCPTIKRTFPWSIIVMDKSPIFAVKAAVIYKSQLVCVETSWKKKGWKIDHYQRKLKNDIKENVLGFNGNLNSQNYWIDLWQHKFYQLPRERKNWAHANLAIKVYYTLFEMYSLCFLFPRSLGPFTEP